MEEIRFASREHESFFHEMIKKCGNYYTTRGTYEITDRNRMILNLYGGKDYGKSDQRLRFYLI